MTRLGDFLPEPLAKLSPANVTVRRANWIEIARMDLVDARRSWALWVICGLFTVLLVLAGMLPFVVLNPDSKIPFTSIIGPMGSVVRWSVPLAGLLVGGAAVAGERDAGSLRVLLGLPISRCGIVVGKLLGRLVVFNAMLLVGLIVAAAVTWYFYHGIDVGGYAIFVALTLLLGSVFVGIGVGLSAMFRTRARTTAASVSVYALVGLVWHVIPSGAFYLVDGRFPENVPEPWNPPAWFVFLGNVNPVNVYMPFVQEWVLGLPRWNVKRGTHWYRHYTIDGTGPFYLQPEFLLVVVFLWALVPLLAGTWRFSRSDLG